jgi:hypothetical protein
MSELIIRLFPDDAAIVHIGEGLLAQNLPRLEWTHEAHIAACFWIVNLRPDITPERDLRAIISSYNEAVGGVNDDTHGYHETITQVYIAAVRAHRIGRNRSETLVESVNDLLTSRLGQRDLPLHFYSRELLFSVQARRKFVAPDRLPLSNMCEIG